MAAVSERNLLYGLGLEGAPLLPEPKKRPGEGTSRRRANLRAALALYLVVPQCARSTEHRSEHTAEQPAGALKAAPLTSARSTLSSWRRVSRCNVSVLLVFICVSWPVDFFAILHRFAGDHAVLLGPVILRSSQPALINAIGDG